MSQADSADLIVDTTGLVRCIYDESIDLHLLGEVSIQRGSHVEPTKAGRWTADLSPVSGPVLGPFDQRSEAVAAEVAWLRDHWLNAR